MLSNQALDENLEESELGQLHAIHLSENAIARVRQGLSHGPSLSHCEDCSEEIPEDRRKAVAGVRRCIFCQEHAERG